MLQSYRYDFHIHSCLSPCGEEEMTPYNLVAMAQLMELDLIALTDHNTTGNCRSAVAAGKAAGLLVIPGMELATREDIHLVCLFPDVNSAEAFGAMVYTTLPPILNRPDLYGRQLLMDPTDQILGEEPRLLINATTMPFDEAFSLVGDFGGICYPAHITRSSSSLLVVFGGVDPSMPFSQFELTTPTDLDKLYTDHPLLKTKKLLYSSDSHRLESLATANFDRIHLPNLSAKALIETLRNP